MIRKLLFMRYGAVLLALIIWSMTPPLHAQSLHNMQRREMEWLIEPTADLHGPILLEVSSGLPLAEEPILVDIQEFAFVPRDLQVPISSTVRWTNRDPVPHTVVSQQAGQFQSGTLGNGQSFERRFDTPGTYAYICSIHPFMSGTITVQPTRPPIFIPFILR